MKCKICGSYSKNHDCVNVNNINKQIKEIRTALYFVNIKLICDGYTETVKCPVYDNRIIPK